MNVTRLLKRALEALGYQVTRNRESSLSQLLHQYSVDHVIDVGSNNGQFARLIRRAGYRNAITAFDPIAECERELADCQPVRFVSAAVGRVAGRVDLNIYSSTDFSSVYKLSERYGIDYKDVPTLEETREVELVALDDQVFPGSSMLLKIDTQGFEVEVLRGAARTLDSVSLLYVECPFLSIYKAGCTAAEIFQVAEEAGFFPARFFANSITKSGAWIDGDVIFVKK